MSGKSFPLCWQFSGRNPAVIRKPDFSTRQGGETDCSPTEPRTDATGGVVAAERRADGNAGLVIGEHVLIAERHGRLAVVGAGADTDAVVARQPGGVDRHLRGGRAHRTQPVDALFLFVEAL